MMLVNTSNQNFENSKLENSWEEFIILKILTKVLKNSKPYVQLLHKPAFIPKHFPNKSTKTPFGCHFLIILLNGSFFMLRCSKPSLVEKTGYRENGDTRKAQIVFAISMEKLHTVR